MSDEITLTLPAERPFHRIAHLVLGGLGVRLELTFDELEDLQVALGALLECCGSNGDVTVKVEADRGGAIELCVGPFDRKELADELVRESSDGLSLRRVLETVVDGFQVSDEQHGSWVRLTKQLRTVNG